ncbi:MAG: TAXI family TRAP transporter solute-binding subunit [Halieaceae bacterium]|jgi:TRAP transporter TAXI family solute receptor|nr:TAXI family TRAP transporter solute-binding subunit [Halieaceae bacterium]
MPFKQTQCLACLILIVSLCLSGCDRGPAPERLQQDLQNRLDQNFQQDLFAVRDFRRTGSAPFRDIEQDLSGVYSYYDAELELQEDYSLSEWLGLNLGTLAYAIGATESGVDGFHAQGNRRGDILRVHGRFAYAREKQGDWTSLDDGSGPRPEHRVEPAVESHGPGPESLLKEARSLLTNAPEYKAGSRQALIIEELDTAVDRIDLRIARLEGKILLGSGAASGTYFSFGEALSRYAGQRGISIFSAVSEGSVANASRLQAGLLDFGLVQSDVAQLLYGGLIGEGFFPNRELRGIASLWPEAVHLLTLQGSGIRQLTDLQGRRVAIGQRGSGSRVNAVLIGLATQLEAAEIPNVVEISLARAISQLESGGIDALFLTEAIPAPSIQALAAKRDDLRFLSVPPGLFAKLAEKHFVYYPMTVPARTYPGQTEPFTTLGLAAAMMTHAGVEDEKVEQMLELLLTGGDELAQKYYRAAFISWETMRLGLAVPLHPAAERFYNRYEQQQDDGQSDSKQPID